MCSASGTFGRVCVYSIIWLTRSLIRPHTVCGGSLGQPATALNLFLIFGSLMELFVLGRASRVQRNALSRTSANTHTHTSMLTSGYRQRCQRSGDDFLRSMTSGHIAFCCIFPHDGGLLSFFYSGFFHFQTERR